MGNKINQYYRKSLIVQKNRSLPIFLLKNTGGKYDQVLL